MDNPHTKPFPVLGVDDLRGPRARFPDTIFLAEAFTPAQDHGTPGEDWLHPIIHILHLAEYETRTAGVYDRTDKPFRAPATIFRPNFFVNTPDINPVFLQTYRPRRLYLIRAALAATLSGAWGVYSGFELCEGHSRCRGEEEYIHSREIPDPHMGLGSSRQHRCRDRASQHHPTAKSCLAHAYRDHLPTG